MQKTDHFTIDKSKIKWSVSSRQANSPMCYFTCFTLFNLIYLILLIPTRFTALYLFYIIAKECFNNNRGGLRSNYGKKNFYHH